MYICVSACTLVQASILPSIEPVFMWPGERLEHVVLLQPPEGVRVQIRLGVAPDNASMGVSESGQLIVTWQSRPDLEAETPIELVVSDIDTGELLESRFLMVRRADESTSQSSLAPSEAENDTPLAVIINQPQVNPPEAAVLELPVAPVMEPLANQVVSPGRVLSFRVDATIADGAIPALQVDRLPRNASFDTNSDGSRSFYWQTSDRDQGEHLFRFTAIHPSDPDLRNSQEVLIVVGDPSRSRTLPAEIQPTDAPVPARE